MDQTKSKTTAADFFIYLGVLIGLYATSISLVSLLFDLINHWLPDLNDIYYYEFYSEGVRLSLAVLIIFFPAFMYLSRISTKAVVLNPEKKEMWVRRWFSFLTLFVSGLAIAVDLAVLVYRFIGGEDLTLRFFLKVIVVLSIAFVIFRYYLNELRRDFTLPTPYRRYFAYITWLVVIISVILGIVAVGLPTHQRDIRFDQQRVDDLQEIQYQITNYWQQKGYLPKTINDLRDEISGFTLPVDPETNSPYVYNGIMGTSFELCATFKAENYQPKGVRRVGNDVWQHPAGYTCFTRTIDKDLYPERIK